MPSTNSVLSLSSVQSSGYRLERKAPHPRPTRPAPAGDWTCVRPSRSRWSRYSMKDLNFIVFNVLNMWVVLQNTWHFNSKYYKLITGFWDSVAWPLDVETSVRSWHCSPHMLLRFEPSNLTDLSWNPTLQDLCRSCKISFPTTLGSPDTVASFHAVCFKLRRTFCKNCVLCGSKLGTLFFSKIYMESCTCYSTKIWNRTLSWLC